MNRKEAIEKIKKAYENKELGFQRGADICSYYDSKTDSCCAVGVLVKDESLFDTYGNQDMAFADTNGAEIDLEMINRGLDELYGLSIDELKQLQIRHDGLINRNSGYSEQDFKHYLYGLKY